MTIYSFRRVLMIRRHIHAVPWSPGKVWRPPIPIPVLGATYFVILEAACAAISRLPILGALAHMPFRFWWVWPLPVTYFAMTASFDGRSPHLWAQSWIRYQWRPKRTRAGVKVQGDARLSGRVRWWFDEYAPELHRARVTGPATVRFGMPVRVQTSMKPSLRMSVQVARRREYAPTDSSHYVVDRMEIKR